MDDLGRAILKERQWNFLLEVGSGANGLETELRAINGIDEIEKRAHGLFLRCTRDVRPEVYWREKTFRSCNSVLKTRPWKKSI
jgi:hypothetical protein